MANAVRAQNAKGVVGAAQAALYGFATQQASYASNFLDVTKGSDGSCSVCSAEAGYDLPSGLGTPNAASLVTALSGAQTAAAPVVSSATVNGKVGVALSFAISATDSHALTYSLVSAPPGMTVNRSTGIVSWSAPVLGAFSVLAQAYDAQTGLSGQGMLSVSIVAPQPPQVVGGAISGFAQTALTFTTQVTDANTVTYNLSGAPYGMAVSTAGVVSWTTPVAGTYFVTLIAHDATTGLSGEGVYTVTIAPPKPPTVATSVGTPSGPVVPTTTLSGVAGKSLAAYLAITDNASTELSITISGMPAGMTATAAGGVLTLKWASPVTGNYSLHVMVSDTRNLTAMATIPVSIAAH
jgi:hypothetical protein